MKNEGRLCGRTVMGCCVDGQQVYVPGINGINVAPIQRCEEEVRVNIIMGPFFLGGLALRSWTIAPRVTAGVLAAIAAAAMRIMLTRRKSRIMQTAHVERSFAHKRRRGSLYLVQRTGSERLPAQQHWPRPSSPSIPPPGSIRVSREHRRALTTAPHVHSGPHGPPGHRLLEARAYDAMAPLDCGSWDMRSAHAYAEMVATATACCREHRLWEDSTFPRSSVPSSDGIRWLSLSQLFGESPHRWPDGRRSHLYAYSHHASEIAGAAPPGGVLQGAIGDCYLLSAVAAVFASASGVEARRKPRPIDKAVDLV